MESWISSRALVVQKRNALREQLHEHVRPLFTQWLEQHSGTDPITGKPVFELQVEDAKITDRPSSNRWVRRLSLTAYDGSALAIEVPDDEAIVKVSGSKRDSGTYVGITAKSSVMPQTALEQKRKDGNLHIPVADMLREFEKRVLG